MGSDNNLTFDFAAFLKRAEVLPAGTIAADYLDFGDEEEKQAYLQGASLPAKGNTTMRMVTANTPVEPYTQEFDSIGDYVSELPSALISRPSEGPLFPAGQDIGTSVKNILNRPLARRQLERQHARSFRMIQGAIANMEAAQDRALKIQAAYMNQPGTQVQTPWGQQTAKPVMNLPPMGASNPAGNNWSRNTGWFHNIISRHPQEFELHSSNGAESTWLHKPTGMRYSVPDAPSPSNRFSVHAEQPNFNEWANAMRWRRGEPPRSD
tara:strand:- start:13039 stop:13836 length:798 start_codon:yes stop_codon:yes gene_type:complete